MSTTTRSEESVPAWRPADPPLPARDPSGPLYRPDILDAIDAAVNGLDAGLRALSLDIHDHPELKFEEKHAHAALTAFMQAHGFEVSSPWSDLETAWLATYSRGQGGQNIGINSEMDALPGIGHACGHNLIAISGVAVACALKAAMEKFDIPGKITVLGTPAEEGGAGKIILLEKGAYKEMDLCLMCHPAPGPQNSIALNSCLALQRIGVEYFGKTAHAALSPWEGHNALDAAVMAYTNISVLRQQLKPTHRTHGIFEGRDWAANIIPDYAKMLWYVRAPTRVEVNVAVKRITACFEAAALATGCRVKVELLRATDDLRQNAALGNEVADIVSNKYGGAVFRDAWGIGSASTDFGNVTYALPSLHPGFAIPTPPNGGNHTIEFTKAARTEEAHAACLVVSKALAAAGARALTDDAFFAQVKADFKADQEAIKSAAAAAE